MAFNWPECINVVRWPWRVVKVLRTAGRLLQSKGMNVTRWRWSIVLRTAGVNPKRSLYVINYFSDIRTFA